MTKKHDRKGPKPSEHPTARRSRGEPRLVSEEFKTGAAAAQSTDQLAELFAALRSGAANVAGVTFQISVTGWLLASGRGSTGGDTDVVSVMPEGFEDIDCDLRSGPKLLVQTKERGVGARAIGTAELAEIVAHAAPALALDPSARFAVVTNGRFGGSLPSTGFALTLADALAAPGAARSRASLVEALGRALGSSDRAVAESEALLWRVHLVPFETDLAESTVTLLRDGLELHPAVASLVRAELLRELGHAAAAQRNATLTSAKRWTLSDLDTLATRIRQAVDVPSLDEAVRAGVCEPADYLAGPTVDLAGFYAGVDVLPAHVAAGFDVVRLEETTSVLDGLATHGDVIIAGPSGSGKSALLWRCAHLISTGARVLRVLRIRDDNDTELLVRHVRRQLPSPDARLLVVADDLGRDRMAAWPDGRRRLAEVPGILILGAVRREDLTPALSASAVVVDPHLTDVAARSIYSAIEVAGIETAMEFDEAVNRAEGLLMEFLALATTGRRLRDVLALQVHALSGDRVRREVLRIVCAAHLLGSAVSADALPSAMGVASDVVGDALARLAGEHLVIAEGRLWRGLHDLRAEIVFELLHATPPPTDAATYAAALALIPPGAQAHAARRAAVRVARRTADDAAATTAHALLTAISEALEPIALGLRNTLKVVAASDASGETTAHAASLLESADRLDTVAYVHAVLPFLERERRPTMDLEGLAWLTYSVAVAGLTFDGPLEPIGALGRQLPSRASRCAAIVATALDPAVITALATGRAAEAAIRFCEAAEAVGEMIGPANATTIYDRTAPVLGDPPGSTASRLEADHRARLTATLAVLARVRGPEVAAIFGPVSARAAEAVACDEYGCSVRLYFEAPHPPSSELARAHTFGPDEMLVAEVRLFARIDGRTEPTAYPAQPDGQEGSINDQAVVVTRRLLDACPEVDQVDVEVWQADRRPVEPDGTKALRAGVVPRPVSVARNVAFQAGVKEALGAENWTRRVREQASVAKELVVLLQQLPRRLERRDNARRRRTWVDRARGAAAAVAALPGRPAERPPVMGSSHRDALERTAAMVDEDLRRTDHGKSALDLLSGAILQVADNLGDVRMVSLAGHRLAEVPARVREARAEGVPVLSGIGETLPPELEDLAAFASRLLTALDVDAITRALDSAKGDRRALDSALEAAAADAAGADGRAVASFFESVGVASETHLTHDERPIPSWRQTQAVLVCDIAHWPTALPALQSWSREGRATAGPTGRVCIVFADGHELLPLGLGFFGAGDVLPLPENQLLVVAEQISLPLRDEHFRKAIAAAGNELVAYSYEQVRCSHREQGWAIPPARASIPSQIADGLRRDFASLLGRADHGELEESDAYGVAAVTLMLELCARVAGEDASEGLAAQLASVDLKALRAPDPDSSTALFEAAHAAASEADRTPHP